MVASILESLSITAGQALLLAALGFFIGVDKMGLRGGPVIFVPFLATAFGARYTSGLIAPLLLGADIIAVLVYRRSWDRKLALRVIGWTVIGICIGVLVGDLIPESIFRIVLGIILLLLLTVMGLLEFRQNNLAIPDKLIITGSTGIIAGFASMLGNAAGPIISLFLLAKKLDKRLFLGTSATIFLVVNAVKLPFHIFVWESVNARTLGMDAIAIPFMLIGAFLGKPVVSIIPERAFRYFIMSIALVGAIRLFTV